MYCKMAKDFFQKNGVAYNEYNVQSDLEKRKEMMDLSGQMGVPVITVDQDLIVGFDRRKLESLLGIGAGPATTPQAA